MRIYKKTSQTAFQNPLPKIKNNSSNPKKDRETIASHCKQRKTRHQTKKTPCNTKTEQKCQSEIRIKIHVTLHIHTLNSKTLKRSITAIRYCEECTKRERERKKYMKVTQKGELKNKTNITLFDEKERKHKNAVIKSIFVFITQTERKKWWLG